MTNIHAFGESLQSVARTGAAAHSISYVRRHVDAPENIIVGPFDASSNPIAQMLAAPELGIDMSDQERSFYFDQDEISLALGKPQSGDIIIDHLDESEWKVVPINDEYSWRYHGQLRQSLQVKTKQEAKFE